MSIKFQYHSQKWIQESDLPEDWFELISNGFSKLAPFFYEASVTDSIDKKVNEAVDRDIINLINKGELRDILDVGVGDGTRLARIGRNISEDYGWGRLYGTDISEKMLQKARDKNIYVIKSDMREPLPFKPASLDMILYISGDFGFIMDKDVSKANRLRLNAIDSAYSILKEEGILHMEVICGDHLGYDKDGKVVHYLRRTLSDGKEVSELSDPFYAKSFTFSEMEGLLRKSKFNIENTHVKYMLRKLNWTSEDSSKSGEIVAQYPCFRNFNIKDIYPNLEDPMNVPNYRTIISIKKII